MTQQTGIVKWFNAVKGYGFIAPEAGDADVFVHHSQLPGEGYRNIHDGDRVSFDLVDVGKGPQARNVKLLHGNLTASEYQGML